MKRLVLTSRIGGNGVLQLTLPFDPADAHREVRVIVEPAAPPALAQEEWRNFILSTAGSIPDPGFERGDQGTYEQREPLS